MKMRRNLRKKKKNNSSPLTVKMMITTTMMTTSIINQYQDVVLPQLNEYKSYRIESRLTLSICYLLNIDLLYPLILTVLHSKQLA